MSRNRDFTNGLQSDLRTELSNLQKVVREVEEVRSKFDNEPDHIQIRALGSLVHDYYTGLENLFEIIVKRVDKDVPEGSGWHTVLLKRMSSEFDDVRPAVIDRELANELKEYLEFRHLFRHIYGFDLNWKRFRYLIEDLPEIHKKIKEKLNEFLEFLENLSDN